jgi:mono/diheme cytochrome c family protein
MLEYLLQKGRDTALKFIAGLVLGLVLVAAAAYLYFTGGSAPVATTDGDMPFERFLAKRALNARVAKEMPKNVPIQLNEANYLAGADLYKQHCAVCHGVPLSPKTAIADGMYPKPPQLLVGKGVTDDEPGESYWKIANGIRLSGMPGFSKSLTETQIWQLATLMANADKLPPSVKTALVTGSTGGTVPATTPAASPAATSPAPETPTPPAKK